MSEAPTMGKGAAPGVPRRFADTFHRWLNRPADPSPTHIPELNGLRVLLVFIVSWYHFWQQSWLTPSIGSTSLDFLVRAGYVPVDGTILLSGFLLFLPHARSMVLGEPVPELRTFYQKRVMRIVPSYYFVTFLILFAVALPGLWSNANPDYAKSLADWPDWAGRSTHGPVMSFGDRMQWISDTYQGDVLRYLGDWMRNLTAIYGGNADSMWHDILRHLTFTQTFDYSTYVGTPIGVASWTIAIEMQAYLIFPLLARAARKHPFSIFTLMGTVTMIFRAWALANRSEVFGYNMTVNQLPNFLDVYAIGMAAALIYVRLTTLWPKNRSEQGWWRLTATQLVIGALVGLTMALRAQAGTGQNTQMIQRPLFALLLAVLVLALPFAVRPIRFLMGNRLMGFLAMISMNYYLIHQNLAVFLKQRLQLPSAANYPFPNMAPGGTEQPWADQYTAMCFGLSLLAAILITFLIEKPCAHLLGKAFRRMNQAMDRQRAAS